MKKKNQEQSYFDNYNVNFTQRNIRVLIREARSVLNKFSPSPTYSKHNKQMKQNYFHHSKQKQPFDRKVYLKKLSKSNKLKLPLSRQADRYSGNKDESWVSRSQQSKSIRNVESPISIKYYDVNQIRGIEEGLVSTKTKLKQKLKTVTDPNLEKNAIKWKSSKEGKNLNEIVVLEARKSSKRRSYSKKRQKTQFIYTPWQTRDKEHSLMNFLPES